MSAEAPPFWWQRPDWRARALAPAAALYGLAAAHRLRRAPRRPVGAPVLCVGNFTVGGEGKTPVALALAAAAEAAGRRPGFLSRGHGGSLRRPHRVDPAGDSVRLVGDEPLLLARRAPTVVARDRAAGARLLVAEGVDFIVMDDGFQSAAVHFDLAVIVVDARRGLGNGRVLPAGPLRAPLLAQWPYVDALVRMGTGTAADTVVRQAARAARPVHEARLVPRAAGWLAGRRVLAFAGIGNPDKVFATLEACGATVAVRRAFADHHPYTAEELDDLAATAAAGGLDLVTTEKDMVRLTSGPAGHRAFAERVRTLAVEAQFDPPDAPAMLVAQTLRAWREGRLRRPAR
ncbi:tetraacyldisaccharide 4'-kinase [Aquibium sp. A9E412]|uniref:tetraacyldisaccharide 4'-kinase n=1 Tax=Aquibium sp. A9E412 TaxID=2976767 RepID=UPI0025AF1132|nr:tetraacyldisaccharide 4'-kinase [Aquibium sp. A9E412]MDN2566243.1 tetraacyldisaccharide 4'-kinase [Aquibium sp. A9E412]